MGYTQFYQEAAQSKPKMSVKALFSDCFKKHSRTDMEYALAAGSIYDRADGDTMLVKWNKPWLWFRVLLVLLALSAADFIIIKVLISLGLNYPIFPLLLVLFATLVTPITMLIFIWELNVPRNISIFSLGLYFVVGGLLSLLFTVLFNLIDWGKESWVAPFAEEPAKLLATLVLVYLFSKKGKNVFGLTGLVIGAAVGTGFTVFETYQYAYGAVFSMASFGSRLFNQAAAEGLKLILMRSLPALNAHLLYCAPYSAAFALAYHKNKTWNEAFGDLSFWLIFAASCSLHALWNYSCDQWDSYVPLIINTLCCFALLYYVIVKCFSQAINEGRYNSGDKAKKEKEKPAEEEKKIVCEKALKLRGVCKKADGSLWNVDGAADNQIVVGRDPSCALCFPADIKGVSRQHCVITLYNGQIFVQDLNSSCGTFVNGKRLSGQEQFAVSAADKIYIGSAQVYVQIG